MPSVTLCFDFGNTRCKCAIFEDDVIIEVITLTDEVKGSIQQLVEKFRPHRAILSSVIDHDPQIEEVLGHINVFTKLSYQTKLPFSSPVTKPDSIGADRLALAAAAVHFYPGKNNLVIGLGSCITYNFINKFNQFLGGSISPGMEMRFKSLQAFTAKLPLVQPDFNFPLIGFDTRTNILSGVILGMAKEIDGIIEAYADQYSNFNVLLTGGDAMNFARHLKNQIFADPELIFKGLYAISEYNDSTET